LLFQILNLYRCASVKEYGLLTQQLAETRPDILAVRISSRACSMAQPVLEEYRERLCKSGFGPYKVGCTS
jgi:hypothetical protein